MNLPHDPVRLSVGWLVARSVGLSVIICHKMAGSLTSMLLSEHFLYIDRNKILLSFRIYIHSTSLPADRVSARILNDTRASMELIITLLKKHQ